MSWLPRLGGAKVEEVLKVTAEVKVKVVRIRHVEERGKATRARTRQISRATNCASRGTTGTHHAATSPLGHPARVGEPTLAPFAFRGRMLRRTMSRGGRSQRRASTVVLAVGMLLHHSSKRIMSRHTQLICNRPRRSLPRNTTHCWRS